MHTSPVVESAFKLAPVRMSARGLSVWNANAGVTEVKAAHVEFDVAQLLTVVESAHVDELLHQLHLEPAAKHEIQDEKSGQLYAVNVVEVEATTLLSDVRCTAMLMSWEPLMDESEGTVTESVMESLFIV